ncbi:MAG: hypothetical protein HW405_159 [Candidatus Berkelbacteria bacterium]|nr:hypothetical protein [Candidatus Berkelbacteria bacterium]
MWDDLPKRNPGANKALIILLVIIIVAVIGYVLYILIRPTSDDLTGAQASPTPSKIINSPSASGSSNISTSPSITALPTPTGTQNYKVPEGETFVAASTADTNGDGKEETLVITKMTNGKYHAYILTPTGENLFDNKEMTKKPVRIVTQTFDSSESYLSWMLVFTEQSGDLAFIHWTGTKYEIPASLGI